MICYKYDPISKIFTQEHQCAADPLELQVNNTIRYVIPADATVKPPLPEKEGFYVVFNEENDSWAYQEKPEEITNEEDPIIEESPSPEKIAISNYQSYLYDTDWYVIREYDAGVPIPEDVKRLRAEAREKISELRSIVQAPDQQG